MRDRSDEVIYYTMLTMIYRGTPTPTNETYDANVECLCAARLALERHQTCAKIHKDSGDEMWSMYLQWLASLPQSLRSSRVIT